jgi:predicted metal-dependent enzyme (double-stranded beta helix superfamily)
MTTNDAIAPLRNFVIKMTELVGQTQDESKLLNGGSKLLSELIKTDEWLPEFCTILNPQYYQQFLLHADPLGRFSVVSFVWGPDQKTPVHDHCVWGLIGMLRGSENGQRFKYDNHGKLIPDGEPGTLNPGDIESVSPSIGDIHIVRNNLLDKGSISIHVYGGNIGAISRHTYDLTTGVKKGFVSGYSSAQVPNLWDQSAEIRAQIS